MTITKNGMTSNSTPGPWIVMRDAEGVDGFFVGGGGFARADMVGPHEDREANAHLIAAAPELLDALKDSAIMIERLKRHLRICDNAGYTRDGRMLSLSGVETATAAAIAKAEGRS